MTETVSNDARHSLGEDVLALIMGTLFVSIGLAMYQFGGIATGGTAGVALLLHYVTGFGLGIVFFVINLPFYVFAYLRMGLAFTIKTFLAVALLSFESYLLPHFLTFAQIEPLFAAIAGGFLIGVGLLILIRHKASLGGLGVLAFYLQQKIGWPAGKVQLVADGLILLSGLFILQPIPVVYSIIGAVALNVVLWINHRAGRYRGY